MKRVSSREADRPGR